MSQQDTQSNLGALRNGILGLAHYALWPAVGTISIAPDVSLGERGQQWAQQVKAMDSEAQLVRLLDALTQTIDHQAAAGFGSDQQRQGDTQAGTPPSI